MKVDNIRNDITTEMKICYYTEIKHIYVRVYTMSNCMPKNKITQMK